MPQAISLSPAALELTSRLMPSLARLGLLDLDLDRLCLCFFSLWQYQAEQPVFEFRVDLCLIDDRRQSEAAHEFAVASLQPVHLSLLRLRLELALTLDRQDVVLETEMQIFSLNL